MAWLWADKDALPEDDQRLIERHLPWTALFPAPGPDGDTLLGHALAHRTELVLKPVGGYGGGGVVLGPEVRDEEWRRALEDARRTGRHILQTHVTPDRLALDFQDQETGALNTPKCPSSSARSCSAAPPRACWCGTASPAAGPSSTPTTVP